MHVLKMTVVHSVITSIRMHHPLQFSLLFENAFNSSHFTSLQYYKAEKLAFPSMQK